MQSWANVRGNLPLKIWTSTTRTTRTGRTISAYLELTYQTLRKSTRIWDNKSNASQKTKWRISMWIRWYGERSMLVTQHAAVHLGNDYLENLHSTKNQSQRTMKQLFEVTRKLVSEQTEIQGVSLTDWQEKSWKRTTLLNDRAVQLSTAKAYVFSESVLCMGRIPDTPASAWREKVDWFMNSPQCRGSRWNSSGQNFPGFTTLQFLADIQNMMTETQCEPEQFQGRIIFMSMYNYVVWRQKGNEEMCIAYSKTVADYAKRFAHRHWSFLGLGSQKNANLPYHLQWTKRCSNVGVTKTVAREQYFTTLDDAELDNLGGSRRECTLPRSDKLSKIKGRIRGNTKIGPALEVAVSHHQGRYGIEIMIQSLLGDGTCSWVMIVNGTNKYVTEMTEETQDDHIDYIGESAGKLVAKTRPKQTSIPKLVARYYISSVSGQTSNQDRLTRVSKCQKDDQIASTRSFSTAKRRRSSRIQNLGTVVSFRIYVFSALVNSSMAELLAKKEEDSRRDFSIVWIHSMLIPSKTF